MYPEYRCPQYILPSKAIKTTTDRCPVISASYVTHTFADQLLQINAGIVPNINTNITNTRRGSVNTASNKDNITQTAYGISSVGNNNNSNNRDISITGSRRRSFPSVSTNSSNLIFSNQGIQPK